MSAASDPTASSTSSPSSAPPPCELVHTLVKGRTPDGLKTVNSYAILSPLGEGAYATVHLVRHIPTSTLYALKKMSKSKLSKVREYSLPPAPGPPGRPALLARPRMFTALDKVRREISIMQRLQSPHLVGLRCVIDDEGDDGLYLVLDYCDAGQVAHWDGDALRYHSRVFPTTAAGGIEEGHLRLILRDVVDAVAYLHGQRVLHRDIKPDNVLACRGEDGGLRVKLADFGVAREFGEGESCWISETQGTYHFYAPEMCSGEKFEAYGADVWAIGVTAFILATNTLPWMSKDNNPAELFENIANAESLHHTLCAVQEGLERRSPLLTWSVLCALRVIRLVFPDGCAVSEQLKDLIVSILQKDPEKRLTLQQIQVSPANCSQPLLASHSHLRSAHLQCCFCHCLRRVTRG